VAGSTTGRPSLPVIVVPARLPGLSGKLGPGVPVPGAVLAGVVGRPVAMLKATGVVVPVVGSNVAAAPVEEST
jgi:hypothetical protein